MKNILAVDGGSRFGGQQRAMVSTLPYLIVKYNYGININWFCSREGMSEC